MLLRPWLLAGVVVAFVALAPVLRADDVPGSDEELLKRHGIATDLPGVLTFLRTRTLKEEDRQNIDKLVAQLGSKVFKERESASRALVTLGEPALPSLRQAVTDGDLEVVRRARLCINDIERGPGPGLPTAALHALIRLCDPATVADEKERTRRVTEALPVLLNYIPFADDEAVEAEVLTALAMLGVRQGKIDPLLQAALTDPAAVRRAPAAFALARAADLEHRQTVRSLFADTEPKVRLYAARGLLGDRWLRLGPEDAAADEKTVTDAGQPADAAGLIAYFRKRTLTPKDRKSIEDLIVQLGSDRYSDREKATDQLRDIGVDALPFLKTAVTNSDPEISRRAKLCIDRIDRGPGTVLPAAAARLLMERRPPEALAVLLDFLPFADDESVEEEVLTALCTLATSAPAVDPLLIAAVKDEQTPARQAAAAYVLGLVGTAEQGALVRPLLQDKQVKVRFRAAQGLLAAKDKTAVPVLAALLMDVPADQVWQLDDVLSRVGGVNPPEIHFTDGNVAERQRARDAWMTWWKDNQDKVELTRLDQGRRQLGLTVISELDSNKVWEYGADGRIHWEIANAQGPIDAHALPGGRVLIAEHNAQRVTERDLKGNIVWTKQTVNQNPVACQRLPNGNTFIATYTNIMEVDRTGKEIFNVNVNNNGRGFPIYGAHRMRNGNILCAGGQAQLIELDSAGKQLKTIPIPNNGGWCSAIGLPNGRYLVALTNMNKVLEVDASGKTLWECPVMSPAHAERLPNGRTLIACMNHRKIVEVDAGGKQVSEKTVTGRPFHAHRR